MSSKPRKIRATRIGDEPFDDLKPIRATAATLAPNHVADNFTTTAASTPGHWGDWTLEVPVEGELSGLNTV